MLAGDRGFALGQFVRQQNAAANLQRIFNGLQAGCQRLPFIVSEIGVHRAGGDDQIVVGQLEAVHLDDASLQIEAQHFAQQDFDVGVLGEDVANGRGDLSRRNTGSRHLVQQRLEGVMILAIEQRDLHRQTRQRLSSLQAAKAAADDDDPRTSIRIHSRTFMRCRNAAPGTMKVSAPAQVGIL